jgi:hypothetical protein
MPPQRVEECRSWPVSDRKKCFCGYHVPKVGRDERGRQSTIDESAIDDHVYVVKAMSEYDYTHINGDAKGTRCGNHCEPSTNVMDRRTVVVAFWCMLMCIALRGL